MANMNLITKRDVNSAGSTANPAIAPQQSEAREYYFKLPQNR